MFPAHCWFLNSSSLTGPFVVKTTFNLDNYVNEILAITNYQSGISGDKNNGTTGHYPFYATSIHAGLSSSDVPGLTVGYVRWPLNAGDSLMPSVYVPRFVNLPWSQIDP